MQGDMTWGALGAQGTSRLARLVSSDGRNGQRLAFLYHLPKVIEQGSSRNRSEPQLPGSLTRISDGAGWAAVELSMPEACVGSSLSHSLSS